MSLEQAVKYGSHVEKRVGPYQLNLHRFLERLWIDGDLRVRFERLREIGQLLEVEHGVGRCRNRADSKGFRRFGPAHQPTKRGSGREQ